MRLLVRLLVPDALRYQAALIPRRDAWMHAGGTLSCMGLASLRGYRLTEAGKIGAMGDGLCMWSARAGCRPVRYMPEVPFLARRIQMGLRFIPSSVLCFRLEPKPKITSDDECKSRDGIRKVSHQTHQTRPPPARLPKPPRRRPSMEAAARASCSVLTLVPFTFRVGNRNQGVS